RLGEVLQELKSKLLALLGVKLGGEHSALLDHRRKGQAVCGSTGDHRLVAGDDIITVDEIEIGIARNVCEQRTITRRLNPVPSHMRDLKFGTLGKPNHFAGDDPQSLPRSVFKAHVEEKLQPQADSQKGFIGGNVGLDRLDEILSAKLGDRVAKG